MKLQFSACRPDMAVDASGTLDFTRHARLKTTAYPAETNKLPVCRRRSAHSALLQSLPNAPTPVRVGLARCPARSIETGTKS